MPECCRRFLSPLMKHLVTPRLLMRPFVESDFDDLFKLYSNAEVMRYIPPFRPLTMEETADSLERMMLNFNEAGYGEFAVIERKEKKFIGKCGLQYHENTGLTELGYLFSHETCDKGYATEASMQVLRTAFNEWGIDKIVAVAHSENRTSTQVMEKIGMIYEKQARFYNNEMVLYSLEKPKENPDSIFEHSYQNSPRLSLHEV